MKRPPCKLLIVSNSKAEPLGNAQGAFHTAHIVHYSDQHKRPGDLEAEGWKLQIDFCVYNLALTT